MSLNVGILAPGKGWGNFVSYISSFKTISKARNTNVILITKKFSSAKSYLEDQQFVKEFYEIPDNNINVIDSSVFLGKKVRNLFTRFLFLISKSTFLNSLT